MKVTGDALTNFRTGNFVPKLVSFRETVMDECGALDDVKDRLIENP